MNQRDNGIKPKGIPTQKSRIMAKRSKIHHSGKAFHI